MPVLADIPFNARSIVRIGGYLYNYVLTKIIDMKPKPLWGPRILYLEISRSCNLKCPMCLRNLFPESQLHGYMPIEYVKSCLKAIPKSIIGVGLGGWGEPLLHPDFLEILSLINKHGLLISFDTNGLLLKEYASDIVKVKTMYHIGISFDFLPGTLTNAHSLYEALEGAQILVEAKRKLGRKYPLVRVTVTLMKNNVHILPELVKLISKYGIRWLDCHEVIVFDPQNLNSLYSPPDWETLTYHFMKAEKLGRNLGVKVTYGRKYKKLASRKPSSKVHTCGVPWSSIFVDFLGFVHPCCYYLSLNLGNIRDESINIIWKNDKYIEFRTRLLNSKEWFCNNCLSGKMYENWNHPSLI